MRAILFFTFLLISLIGFSQTEKKDPWATTKFEPGVRVEMGLQNGFYTSVNFNLHRAGGGPVKPFGINFYTGIEWQVFRNVQPLYKVGMEYNGHLSIVGLEVKSDFDNSLYLAPKVGLGIWGMGGIVYSHHINLKEFSPKDRVVNQIGIFVTLDKLFLTEEKVGFY